MLLMPLCRLPTNNATFSLCGNPKCILIPDAGRSRPPDLNSRVSVLPCFTLNRPAPRLPSLPCMGEPRSFDRGSGFLNFSTSSCRFVGDGRLRLAVKSEITGFSLLRVIRSAGESWCR